MSPVALQREMASNITKHTPPAATVRSAFEIHVTRSHDSDSPGTSHRRQLPALWRRHAPHGRGQFQSLPIAITRAPGLFR